MQANDGLIFLYKLSIVALLEFECNNSSCASTLPSLTRKPEAENTIIYQLYLVYENKSDFAK